MGTAVVDMRYEDAFYMAEDAGAADLIAGGRIQLGTMTRYLVLLRGINVGGRNNVPMAGLRGLVEELGFQDVTTYIASGNLLLSSDLPAAEIKGRIEAALPRTFRLDSDLISVLVLTHAELRAVIESQAEGVRRGARHVPLRCGLPDRDRRGVRHAGL